MHEPIRLSVFIEAPAQAMDDIVVRHEIDRQLVDNGWLHLFQIRDNGSVRRRIGEENWQPAVD